MRPLTALYAIAIFLSAFLLFLIEPMMGKRLIPLLGGSAAVWTTCLVFFQFALLAGYLYAHRLVMRLHPRSQGVMHVGLLVVAFALFYFGSHANLHADTATPVRSVFLLLAFLVGAPFLALSATSPLLQAWYSASFAEDGGKAAPPYHLFALSNLGSLLALVTYPLLIEPRFSLHVQTVAWTIAFATFALACGGIALKHRSRVATAVEAVEAAEGAVDPAPSLQNKILWMLFAACGSLLLCAITNHLTQNIAAIPLLWILPLIMYLLSFVLIFNPWGFYPRRVILVLLAGVLAVTGYFLMDINTGIEIRKAIPFYCSLLLISCLFCHGEVYRLRPAPRYATSFYLYIAAGGALGALFVGVLAPLIFSANYEFLCGLMLLTGLAFVVNWSWDRAQNKVISLAGVLVLIGLSWLLRGKIPEHWHLLWMLGLLVILAIVVTWIGGVWQQAFWLGATAAMVAVLIFRAYGYKKDRVLQVRNFYGTLRVTSELEPNGTYSRHLYNGTIEHGKQYIDEPEFRHVPTTYYAEDSGVGIAMRYCCGNRLRRIGVIGLGAGTMAAYGRPGDDFRFYDINPVVEKIAKNNFTYLSDSAAQIHIILGDARVSLSQETPQNFDVLVVDAFSGDAIPVHLLTTQALALYRTHMRPGGIIAFHVSNRYLNLEPVIQQQAEHAGMDTAYINNADNDERGEYGSDWVLVTDDKDFLESQPVMDASYEITVPPKLRLWTDDYNSLLPILRAHETDDE